MKSLDIANIYTPQIDREWKNGRFIYTGKWSWLRNLLGGFA